ncbi:SubName: Full=Uncharacterized protein {ECO:0000313/EMBL:CCA70260.1} [Serendipita indica DSM 11827]|uniref:Uncharacterized protein n=1 Tax=Serendipita indica (strain DSM 11827) TaxID=1109443 RepID=G4TG31_SERID|nr:SubName: Full=Uncharacterized protein {ECO:0000313/EMBL:CCA70260.1} [Serendipita indica DSM 11827]CCA70260.1 hypothetical protein PIIN_04199 [Serendipita indica DSM 11827]
MTSKTPVNGVGYDKSLLKAAPAVSKLDKQEGYDPTLLEAKPASPAPGRKTPANPASPIQNKYAGSDESPKAAALPIDREAGRSAKGRKPNKTKWIIGAVVIIILIIGIGVGVGVGVGAKRRNNDSSSPLVTTGSGAPAETGGSEPTKTVAGQGDFTKTDTTAPTQQTNIADGGVEPASPNSPPTASTTGKGGVLKGYYY